MNQSIFVKVKKGNATIGAKELTTSSKAEQLNPSDVIKVQSSSEVIARQDVIIVKLYGQKTYTYKDVQNLISKKKSASSGGLAHIAFIDPIQKDNQIQLKASSIRESEIRRILRKTIKEEMEGDVKSQQPRCVPENVIPLDEIVGFADDYIDYAKGVNKRKMGVNSMVDTLGILNNIRLFNDIKDGGSNLAYNLMHHLNKFRNKNYYDETTGKCNKAMDKIIELYKENEHGTELVKDIERVLALQTKDDDKTPSPRTKEYLKRCLELVKGK